MVVVPVLFQRFGRKTAAAPVIGAEETLQGGGA
jgi:hypothetical protein